jgi:uncharacterized membrane protein
MAWLIGLLLGAFVGGLAWGWSGAVTLGFIGWLVGVIVGSSKKSPPKPAAAFRPAPAESTLVRMTQLEQKVAVLEERLAKLEGGGVVEPVAVEPPAEAAAAEPEAAPEPASIPEPSPPPIPEPPPTPPVPAVPPKPNFIVAWFTGGNAIVRIGAVILFVGLVFLLNYAREHQLIAPEFRVAGVAAFGIALLVLGWRLREKRTGYAVSLQGAGVAILYLTIFAAMRLYHLVSPEIAFFLLAAMAAFSAVLAVGQDSLALAIIGAGGGFLAPILASTGGGNHVALFSYYLVLNGGLVLIAWFKAWRSLNVVGLLFTFLIGLAWGTQSYRDELFPSTEPFLIAFFLLYVAIAVLFARSSSSALGSAGNDPAPLLLIDGTVTFGTPLMAFGLQAGMLHDTEFGLAYSALAAAILYVSLSWTLMKGQRERWSLLAESFLALGVALGTLAIPLALDARWTSASWALEGAAILWIGVRQRRRLARAFGLLLQLGAGIAYATAYARMPAGPPLVDAPFIGALLVGLAGVWTHRLLATGGDRVTETEAAIASAPFLWGLAWLLFAGHHEIDTFLSREVRYNVHAELCAALALAFMFLGRKREWPESRWPGLALVPALVLVAFLEFLWQSHPFAGRGWISWPLVFAAVYYVLHEFDARDERLDWLGALHAAAFLLACALGAWEMNWAAARVTAHETSWSVTAVLLVPAMLLLFVVSPELDARWPVGRHVGGYRIGGVLPVLIGMGVWILYANATHDGTSTPLPYLPIVNAIDLGHGLIGICVMGTVIAWRRSKIEVPEFFRGRNGWVIVGVLAFAWLNGVLLRSLHHWADVPYRLEPMMRSVVVQASISVFWTVIALALMMYATRNARRALWMTGAALMGVVVVKLFLIDLGHLGGIERIVSFIGVGLLMLVIGYFSPLPPRAKAEAASAVEVA